jgi:hypothetical protein
VNKSIIIEFDRDQACVDRNVVSAFRSEQSLSWLASPAAFAGELRAATIAAVAIIKRIS